MLNKKNNVPIKDLVIIKAKELISGQRQIDYGDAIDSFSNIAAFWSTYLGKQLTAEDVAIMMTLFKISRIKTGSGTLDSFIDTIGYIALGADIHFKDKNKTV